MSNVIYVNFVRLADDLPNEVDPTAHTGFDKVQLSAIFIGVLLPLVVGLITKRYTSASTKAILLLAASALTAFVTEWANSENFVWQQAVLTMLLTFGTGYVAHAGLWTNVKVGDKTIAAKAQDAFGGDKPKAA
jgi:hypothetical protein